MRATHSSLSETLCRVRPSTGRLAPRSLSPAGSKSGATNELYCTLLLLGSFQVEYDAYLPDAERMCRLPSP